MVKRISAVAEGTPPNNSLDRESRVAGGSDMNVIAARSTAM